MMGDSDSMNIETFCQVFRDVIRSVHSSHSVKDVLDLVVRKSTEALQAKGAIVRLLNLETGQLELGAACGLGESYLAKGPVSSQKIITDLYRLNRVIIIDDLLHDPRIQYPREAWAEGIRMMIDVPLHLGESMVGILRIFLAERREFSQEELNFVVSIAEQCACAIEKAQLIEAQQSRYDHLALQTEKLSALGRMAAGIAHEINNPLAGILLYSSNLAKKAPAEGPLKEGLEVIIHETIRCRSIIQELLEFSRENEPVKVLASINDIIDKTLAILENEFRIHHIQVDKNLAETMVEALLDVNQMEQVLVNLLLNAVEAIQEKGVITISSQGDQRLGSIRVEIADTGCGIAPEHLPRLFEPFFSTKAKGTGLGLAVSYGIIRSHQGNIEVNSQPGRGTCFTIELPLPPAARVRQGQGIGLGTG